MTQAYTNNDKEFAKRLGITLETPANLSSMAEIYDIAMEREKAEAERKIRVLEAEVRRLGEIYRRLYFRCSDLRTINFALALLTGVLGIVILGAALYGW